MKTRDILRCFSRAGWILPLGILKVKDAPEKTGNIMVRPEVRSLLHEQCLGIRMMRTFAS